MTSLLSMLLPVLGGLLAVGVCGFLVVAGVMLIRNRSRLVAQGVRVQALIISVRARSVPGGGFSYIPTVRYELHGRVWESVPEGGQHVLRTGTVMQTRGMSEGFIGKSIEVMVNPGFPNVCAVRGKDRRGVLLVVLGSVFGALILLFVLVGVVASLLQQG